MIPKDKEAVPQAGLRLAHAGNADKPPSNRLP
jgi:hypothetical protein